MPLTFQLRASRASYIPRIFLSRSAIVTLWVASGTFSPLIRVGMNRGAPWTVTVPTVSPHSPPVINKGQGAIETMNFLNAKRPEQVRILVFWHCF